MSCHADTDSSSLRAVKNGHIHTVIDKGQKGSNIVIQSDPINDRVHTQTFTGLFLIQDK